jgi:hypothetical protein
VPTPKPALRLDLVPRGHSDLVPVNGRCDIHEEEDLRIVLVSGVPIFRCPREDRAERDLLVAQALGSGYAMARELASAMSISVRTVSPCSRSQSAANGPMPPSNSAATATPRTEQGPVPGGVVAERSAVTDRYRTEAGRGGWRPDESASGCHGRVRPDGLRRVRSGQPPGGSDKMAHPRARASEGA